MSVSQILGIDGYLLNTTIPDLRRLGYTNEGQGKETPHVMQTRGRLVLVEGKTALLDLATTSLRNRVTALETNGGGGDLGSRVAVLEELVARLTSRLAYAEAYLQMIDEAIAVEGFPGWSPPS